MTVATRLAPASGSAPSAAPSGYRWLLLAVGTASQVVISLIQLGIAVLVPELRSSFGLSLGQTGVLLAAFTIGGTSTLIPWGLVADAKGERVTLAVGLGTASVALAGATVTHRYLTLLALLALAGCLSGGGVVAVGRAVMVWFPRSERGLALGVRQAGVPLGGLIASFALPALGRAGLPYAFGALSGGFGLCAVCGALTLREPDVPDEAHEMPSPFRDPHIWRIASSTSLLVIGQSATLSFTVLFLHIARGVSIAAAAAVFAAIQVVGIAGRILAGHWSDRRDLRVLPLRRLGLGITLTLVIVAVLTSTTLWALVPALIVAGGVAHSWAGLPYALAAERAGAKTSGVAIGIQQTAAGLGASLGPIAIAFVVVAWSWRVAFLTAALFPILAWFSLRPVADR